MKQLAHNALEALVEVYEEYVRPAVERVVFAVLEHARVVILEEVRALLASLRATLMSLEEI